ncbi:hypothetical protein BDA99DRAFT_205527 [Phascolomyces articulosus]|uniref:Uncharacterized protein n=1 Tax=Phascolomyces articulosus TaxID=60185 RepID=A0AAD5PBA6_9FUNG|nr:hypothetical protein BDA99DRAFT_205527 [Phascolomyces articulosus]
MSNRLAKQTLDLILKNSNGSSIKRKQQQQPEEKKALEKKRLRLPDTKKGIKKVKYEMRYGQQQKAKAALAELEKKGGNPLDALYEEEEALQDNLERNLRILQAHRLKASENERKMRKKLVRFNKQSVFNK